MIPTQSQPGIPWIPRQHQEALPPLPQARSSFCLQGPAGLVFGSRNQQPRVWLEHWELGRMSRSSQLGAQGAAPAALVCLAQPGTHQWMWESRKTLLLPLPALGTACARPLRSPAEAPLSIPTWQRAGWGSWAVPQGSPGSPGRAQGRARCSTPALPAGTGRPAAVTWGLEVDSPHLHGVLGVVGGDLCVVQEALGPWL